MTNTGLILNTQKPRVYKIHTYKKHYPINTIIISKSKSKSGIVNDSKVIQVSDILLYFIVRII